MTDYINEYSELRKYHEMAARLDEIKKIKRDIEFDTFSDWCDRELSDRVIQLCADLDRYHLALSSKIDAMTEELYNKLDYADENMSKKSFWKRIFKRGES